MEEQTKDIKDYLLMLRRRRRPMLATVGILFVIVVAVATLWPSSYRSTATILIEEQEIPQDLVRSTISSYADQRIQVISQQVMTRANLMQIVEKYGLYTRYRRTHTNEETLDRLGKDIKLDIVKADVIDQRSGTKTTATIAFTLSYDGETPTGAQKVANELVSLYLNENLKNREQKTAETSTFLAEETAKLSEHISEVQKQLAAFKSKHMGRLPELTPLNMQLRDRTDNELMEVDRQLLSLDERKFYLEAQLAQIKPNTPLISASGERILDPGERLKTLQAQYASLSGVYSPNHPDIVKMRREIAALQKETGSGAEPQEPAKRLIALRADLATARDKYSDDHPDIIKLRKSIAALEAEQASSTSAKAPAVKPENPAYIALQAQLESTLSEMKSLRAKQVDLRVKIGSYERALVETPQVEREYLDLTRDQETSVARYREIKQKQMQAQISQELEKDRKGERFSLIDPPQLPEQPRSPNRPAILLLGFVFSMGGGLASAALLENLDHSVRGSKTLADLLQVPVLAVIPYMETQHEKRHRRRVAAIIAASSVAALVLALLLVHFFWIPLDVLWFRALRKLNMYVPVTASGWGQLLAATRFPWIA
jgi:succinoglycan biosynthesis transport protein ExoP